MSTWDLDVMFVDEAQVSVRGGNGGSGCVSFRRERFVPRGGPDGGDGGDGGDVIFVADPNQRTLSSFRHQPVFRAQNGQHGQGKKKTGASGWDAVVLVPVGTIVKDVATGELVADMSEPGTRFLVARGGPGGRGNVHFRSSTRQAPRMATPGGPGEERDLFLTLKLLADVGLVGLPNVGKSTLLSRLSEARPRIADYPFTTLQPNLGVVSVGEGWDSFVLADLPGLIEGAHMGKGLGHRFLRHVERTRLLILLIDGTSQDPERDLELLENELAQAASILTRRPRRVVLTKADLVPESERGTWSPAVGGPALWISSVTGEGLKHLKEAIVELMKEPEERLIPAPEETVAPDATPVTTVVVPGDVFHPETDPKPWPTRWVIHKRTGATCPSETQNDGSS